MQRAVELVERAAKVASCRRDERAVVRLAQQLEEDARGVDEHLLLQRGGDAAAQRALFIARIVERFGVDYAAVAIERAPEQIVRRDVVVIARLFDEREPRLADAVFIVGQKRLRNAELFRGLALGDPLFLPQQGKGAGKVSIHGNNLVK